MKDDELCCKMQKLMGEGYPYAMPLKSKASGSVYDVVMTHTVTITQHIKARGDSMVEAKEVAAHHWKRWPTCKEDMKHISATVSPTTFKVTREDES